MSCDFCTPARPSVAFCARCNPPAFAAAVDVHLEALRAGRAIETRAGPLTLENVLRPMRLRALARARAASPQLTAPAIDHAPAPPAEGTRT